MSTHLTDSLYTSYSQIHRAIVQYSSTTTGEIYVIIPAVTGLDTSVPVSYFGREAHPFENDWVVPNVGSSIIVCREDEDYTSVFWINTTYNPVRDASAGEANPTAYNFGPAGSVSAFDLIDFGSTPTSSGLYLGSVNMGYYNATATEWRTYMDYNGNFYLRGSGTNALTWNGSTLAVSGAITASTIDIGTGNTILKVDAAGNLSIGHATPSSAPFQVSNAGAVTASNLTITGGGININSGVFAVTSAGALTATNATITGAITATSGSFTGAITATSGTFNGAITSSTIASTSININTAFQVSALGVLTATGANISGAITATSGTFSGALSAGTITGDWEITTGELKIAATTDTSTMLTLKNDGTNAMLVADVAGQSLPGYVLVNKASDHSNLQLLAPAMTGSTRPGMTIKHYTGGGSYVNIGTDDSDPQILLQDTGTGTATITSTDINLNASGVLYLRGPAIRLATTDSHNVYVDYNGIYFGDDQPAATAHRLYRNGNDLHWNGSAIGGSSGTVTSVATSGAITGGTITTTGTIGFNEAAIGGTGHSHAQYLPLTGGTLSGDLTLTGYRNVSATNSLYLRTNTSTTNITCYSAGATQLHSGGTAILNAGNSYVTIYKSIKPSPSYAPSPPAGLTCGVASSGVFLNMYSQSYSGSSDENLKTDIADATYGLDFVKGLRPRTFKWAQTVDEVTGEVRVGGRKHHGFIAQEVEAYLGDDADHMGLWNNGYSPAIPAEVEGDVAQEESSSPNLLYMEFIPILTKALQEISTKLDAAEARIATLESA